MQLTDNAIRKLAAPARGNRISYDATVKGFGLRVTATGARSFVLNYRRRTDGRERRITIGSFPDWTAVAAREEAKRLKRDIDGGADPDGEQEANRDAPTVAELCARFSAEYLPRKRPSTQRGYRQQIETDILPPLGGLKVYAVTHGEIDALHRKISARAPTHANRVIALLSRLFTLAVRWGMRSDNPVRGIEHNREHKRERFLSGDELARVSRELAELRDQSAANAIRLLLLTGARRGELLSAVWSDFDLQARAWTKPQGTTKSGKVHRVPLSEAAAELLADMRKADPDGVHPFPSPGTVHRRELDRAWDIVRTAAGIPDVRIHDLRHSYASMLASAGLSLPVIGALLGHSSPATTNRYAHILDTALRAATEKAAHVITSASRPKLTRVK